MKDRFNREIEYMRLSITEACNLSCIYCNPEGSCCKTGEEGRYFSPSEFGEICAAACDCGIHSFKITGGEPLLRDDCEEIVRTVRSIEGVSSVTLTTNGRLLNETRLSGLVKAGLDGINLSLDSLNPETDSFISGLRGAERSLEALRLAAGIRTLRVKLNAVPIKGVNDSHEEIAALAGLAEKHDIDVRFIELMPLGYGNKYTGVSGIEVLRLLKSKFPKMARELSKRGNGPAKYFRIDGFKGRIGFISPIGDKFCAGCNRIRLTAGGELKPCLCYAGTENIRSIFDEEDPVLRKVRLRQAIERAVASKPEGHCFEHRDRISERNSMVNIGG